MSFSLSADEYALFVSQYTRKPEEYKNIHFIFSLNQSRFMHLIFNIIQRDIYASIFAIFLLPITWFWFEVGWLVAYRRRREKMIWYTEILSMFLGFIWTSWKEGNCSFVLKIYISSSNIWKLRLLPLMHVPRHIGRHLHKLRCHFTQNKHTFYSFLFWPLQKFQWKTYFFCCTTSPPPSPRQKKIQESFRDSSGQTVYLSDIQVHTCTITFSPFLWKWQTFRCNFLGTKQKKKCLSNC